VFLAKSWLISSLSPFYMLYDENCQLKNPVPVVTTIRINRPDFLYYLYSPRGPWPLLSVSWSFSQTVGLLGRVISSSQGLYLNTGQHKHRINAYTHRTSMPWVGFKPTIPASEREKTVYALDLSATVIVNRTDYAYKTYRPLQKINNFGSAIHRTVVIMLTVFLLLNVTTFRTQRLFMIFVCF
jgi:hypothetical protein